MKESNSDDDSNKNKKGDSDEEEERSKDSSSNQGNSIFINKRKDSIYIELDKEKTAQNNYEVYRLSRTSPARHF